MNLKKEKNNLQDFLQNSVKFNINAFTFVELIVSITILALITTISVVSFGSRFKWSSIIEETGIIKSFLQNYEDEIKFKKITSYNIKFQTWSTLFLVEKNYYLQKNKFTFDGFDYKSLSWILRQNEIVDWSINFDIDGQNVLYNNKTWTGEIYIKNDNYFQEAQIYWIINNTNVNSFDIIRLGFSSDYLFTSKNQIPLELIEIKNDSSWNCGSLEIENIMWKRTMKCDGSIIKKAKLKLEKQSETIEIEI